jgi:DNA polymerase I-like protein with 3'-5' exonuclease and polymerase domains
VPKAKDGKLVTDFGSPFNQGNRVVLAGAYSYETEQYTSYDTAKPASLAKLKELVSNTDVLVGHNIKYDALWLKAIGCDTAHLKYRDTMLREYLMWQGNHPSLALTAVAPRYGGKPKMDIISDLFDRNVNTNQIPRFILAEYLYDDVMNTKIVYEAQMKDKRLTDQKVYDLFYHDVLETVIEMEWNGAKFNDEAKTSVSEAIDEQLFISMQKVVDLASKYVDKATFNPDSPQQMARIMYGLEFKHGKPDDKKAEWVDKEKHQLVKAKWKGFVSKFKPHETGAQGKLEWMVNECFDKIENSLHIKPDVAWLTSKDWIGDTGFSSSSKVIDSMLASGKLNKKQEEFVAAAQAYSKASTWKTSNLMGVFDGIRDDGYVHGQINMHVTSTRRFSASAPNTQNWPREGTNPIKQLIKSRYEGGHIVCADYGQLEFRVVGLLSNDTQLIKDVNDGIDIHSHTATVAFGSKFTEAEGKERKEYRQKAKTKTFEFQYGARPKNKIDQAIYDAFYGKYYRISNWQERTCSSIAGTQRYVCPFTGVLFFFEGANHGNEYQWATKAVNYPVQFLADCVNKCALVGIYNRIKGRQDIKLILTVHDSNVLDAAPHAVEEAKQILKEEMEGVSKTFQKYFNKTLDIPLAADVSSGGTWYDQQ